MTRGREMRRSGRAVAVALAVAMALSSGCSAIMVRRPPSEPEPARWPRCTEHTLYPLFDTAYAALMAVSTVMALNSDDEWAPLGVVFALPMTLGFGGSAIYGWNTTARCGAAREAYERAAEQGR